MNKQTKEEILTLEDVICIWVNNEKLRMPAQEYIKKNPEHAIPVGTVILIDVYDFLFCKTSYKTSTAWVQSRLKDPDNIPTYIKTHTSFEELVKEVLRHYNEV